MRLTLFCLLASAEPSGRAAAGPAARRSYCQTGCWACTVYLRGSRAADKCDQLPPPHLPPTSTLRRSEYGLWVIVMRDARAIAAPQWAGSVEVCSGQQPTKERATNLGQVTPAQPPAMDLPQPCDLSTLIAKNGRRINTLSASVRPPLSLHAKAVSWSPASSDEGFVFKELLHELGE
jgi:hypothetical protein